MNPWTILILFRRVGQTLLNFVTLKPTHYDSHFARTNGRVRPTLLQSQRCPWRINIDLIRVFCKRLWTVWTVIVDIRFIQHQIARCVTIYQHTQFENIQGAAACARCLAHSHTCTYVMGTILSNDALICGQVGQVVEPYPAKVKHPCLDPGYPNTFFF